MYTQWIDLRVSSPGSSVSKMCDSSDDDSALIIDIEGHGSQELSDVSLRLDPALRLDLVSSDEEIGQEVQMDNGDDAMVHVGDDAMVDDAMVDEMDNGADAMVDELLSLASSGASAAEEGAVGHLSSSSAASSDGIAIESFQGSDSEGNASECQRASLKVENWQTVTVLALEECLTAARLRTSLFFTEQNLSHTFAGIGSVEIAVGEISQAISSCLGRSCLWRCRATCEISSRKRQKLMQSNGQACHHKDVTDVCSAWSVKQRHASTFEEKCSLVAKSDFSMNGMECDIHGARCHFPEVHGEIAGSPCTPWSRIGSRLGKRHKLIHLLIIWCYWLRARLTPWAIHENVFGFDVDILHRLLGDLYAITVLRINPATYGMLVNRPRLYIILLLRTRVRTIASISDTFQFVMERQRCLPRVDLSSYLIASDEDLLSAENAKRRQRRMPLLVAPSADWQYLLTTKQLKYLSDYRAKWFSDRGQSCDACPNCIFDLSQNPKKRRVQTNRKGDLPTIRSGGLWWIPSKRRWALSDEVAYLSGIPMQMIKAYDYTWDEIGNAMHIASIGTVLCVCLACIQWA